MYLGNLQKIIFTIMRVIAAWSLSQILSNHKTSKKLANQKWKYKQQDIRTSFWEPLHRRTIPVVLSVCDAG